MSEPPPNHPRSRALADLDALIAQLRTRLSFDPYQADTVARLRTVRQSLVRSGDLLRREGEPGERDAVDALVTRLDRVVADAARGADVSGPLAELEAAAARGERDAIVSVARRHERDRYRPEVLARLMAEYDFQLKFVVDQPDDIGEIEQLLLELPELSADRVLLMPQGRSGEELAALVAGGIALSRRGAR